MELLYYIKEWASVLEVDEIWQYRTGENLTIFNKDHDTAKEGRSRRFLQPSIRLRYNYYVQLVAIRVGCAYRM